MFDCYSDPVDRGDAKKRQRKERQEQLQKFLKTLRRVPDQIVLASGVRELDMEDGDSCLCGTFIREALSLMTAKPFERVMAGRAYRDDHDYIISRAFGMFGGTEGDWHDIYWGVTDEQKMPLIEEAFVRRVLEAVKNS